VVVAARASVDVAAEELAGSEAGQAEALSAEVCLVGVPGVDGQAGHAVCTSPTCGGGTGLSQREKSLKP
jgi:hypothetical protein